MMKLSMILPVAAIALGIFLAAGLTQGSASGGTGELLFKQNCLGCHPGGGNVIKPDKPIKGAPQLKTFEAFLAWIRSPVAPMPAYSSATISDDQAKMVYDYILKQERGGWK